MEYAIVPSDQTVNAAYHSQVDPGLRRYKNFVITQRQTGPCGLFRQCIYIDNSITKMYIALIFIHIHYYTLYQNIIFPENGISHFE